MSPKRSALILVHVSPRHAHLPEHLAERGYEIAQSCWGISGRSPQVIITDQPAQLAKNHEIMAAIRERHAGLVVVDDNRQTNLCKDIQPDAQLPSDPASREVASVIDLVAQLVEQRRRIEHEREECRRWIELAMHDALTGLPNRRAWDEELARSLAGKSTLCIGLIDVDYFKQVNDVDGHDMGDAVLSEASRALQCHLRSGDFVARLGGDEFGLIIRDVDAAQAQEIIDRLRHIAVGQLTRRRLPAPTLSAGFCVLRVDDPRDADTVYAAAAAALQAAKRHSRDCVVAAMADKEPYRLNVRQT